MTVVNANSVQAAVTKRTLNVTPQQGRWQSSRTQNDLCISQTAGGLPSASTIVQRFINSSFQQPAPSMFRIMIWSDLI